MSTFFANITGPKGYNMGRWIKISAILVAIFAAFGMDIPRPLGEDSASVSEIKIKDLNVMEGDSVMPTNVLPGDSSMPEPGAPLPEKIITPSVSVKADHHELPVPQGMEDKTALWAMVYGEYSSSQLILYNRKDQAIIYDVVYDFPGKRKRAIERTRTRLYAVHHIVKNSDDPAKDMKNHPDGGALLNIYNKFAGVSGKDKFAVAARRDNIGILRGRKNELEDALYRAAPYMPEMERIFKKEGVPEEITRLVFVESMFDREAESSKGAAGVWQILTSTAKPYLVMTRTMDERRDPIASTRAAGKILKHNYERLGSWPLAVTAYNAGTTRMLKAKKACGTSDLAKIFARYDHENIGFAVENFYVRLVGVIRAEEKISAKTKKPYYGVDPTAYDSINLPKSFTVIELAKKLGMKKNILIIMNPAWTGPVEQGWAYVPRGYLLRAPKGSGPVVKMALGMPAPPRKDKIAKTD